MRSMLKRLTVSIGISVFLQTSAWAQPSPGVKPAAGADASAPRSNSRVGSSPDNAVPRCGMQDGYTYVASVFRCADGTNPLAGSLQAAHRARQGNAGANAEGHIIDVYQIDCPEGTQTVFVDNYACSPEMSGLDLQLLSAENLIKSKRSAEAIPILERIVAIQERHAGATHPATLLSMERLATALMQEQQYGRSESLLRRIVDAERGRGQTEKVATLLMFIGYLCQQQENFAAAEIAMLESLRLMESLPDRPSDAKNKRLIELLDDLAALYERNGDFVRAKAMRERKLKLIGAESPTQNADAAARADAAYEEGMHYLRQGAHGKASLPLARAEMLQRKLTGRDRLKLAQTLRASGLAVLGIGLDTGRDPMKLFTEALQIRESILGPNHPEVATSLCDIADGHVRAKRYDQALPLVRRAIRIFESAKEAKKHDLAYSLQILAALQSVSGSMKEAAQTLSRSLALVDDGGIPFDPQLQDLLNDSGALHVNAGQIEQALPLFRRVLIGNETLLQRAGTEGRAVKIIHSRAKQLDLYASVAVAHRGNDQARRLALAAALMHKGRSFQIGAESYQNILHSLDNPAQKEKFAELQAARSRLAAIYQAFVYDKKTPDGELARWSHKAEALEDELLMVTKRVVETNSTDPLTWIAKIAQRLPAGSVYVDFISYSPYRFDRGTAADRWQENRYLCLLLFPDNRVEVVPLAEEKTMDAAVRALLESIVARKDDYQVHAKRVYDLLFAPILPALGGRQLLYVSPDDELNRLPFAALHDGAGFLADKYQLVYMISGREFLRERVAPPPSQSFVLFADPLFKEGIRPLPGTKKEASALSKLVPSAELHLATDATKEALLAVRSPRVLHIATHGYAEEPPDLLVDMLRPRARPPAGASGTRTAVLAGESPKQEANLESVISAFMPTMYRSFLLLAREKAAAQSLGQDRVTAAELLGMQLDGTELVVLSACETGRGSMQKGQGVFGLQRAFLSAGARAVVASLWQVADDRTSTLMTAFYKHLLTHKGRAEALQLAMQEMRATGAHPYYWAAFTMMGEPGSIVDRQLAARPTPAAPAAPTPSAVVEVMTPERAERVLAATPADELKVLEEWLFLADLHDADGNEQSAEGFMTRFERRLASPVAIDLGTVMRARAAMKAAFDRYGEPKGTPHPYDRASVVINAATALLPSLEQCFAKILAAPPDLVAAFLLSSWRMQSFYHSFRMQDRLLEALYSTSLGRRSLWVAAYELRMNESGSGFQRAEAAARRLLGADFAAWYRRVRNGRDEAARVPASDGVCAATAFKAAAAPAFDARRAKLAVAALPRAKRAELDAWMAAADMHDARGSADDAEQFIATFEQVFRGSPVLAAADWARALREMRAVARRLPSASKSVLAEYNEYARAGMVVGIGMAYLPSRAEAFRRILAEPPAVAAAYLTNAWFAGHFMHDYRMREQIFLVLTTSGLGTMALGPAEHLLRTEQPLGSSHVSGVALMQAAVAGMDTLGQSFDGWYCALRGHSFDADAARHHEASQK